jgi:hypothetical protein
MRAASRVPSAKGMKTFSISVIFLGKLVNARRPGPLLAKRVSIEARSDYAAEKEAMAIMSAREQFP